MWVPRPPSGFLRGPRARLIRAMPVPDPPACPVGLCGPPEQLQLFDDQRESGNDNSGRFLINGNGNSNSNAICNGDAHATVPLPSALPSPPPLAAANLISNDVPPRAVHFNGSEKSLHPNGNSVPSLKAISLSSYYRLHRVPSFGRMSEPDSGTEDPQAVKLPRRESTTEAPPNLPPNGIHNKILEQVVRTPGRIPSPQPTHLSVPGPQSRVLHEHGSGYVAPKFEGKESQMDQGESLKIF